MGFEVNNRSGDDTRGLDRIIFFSDAVFAIVMTLLILDIPVSDIPPASAAADCRAGYSICGPSSLAMRSASW